MSHPIESDPGPAGDTIKRNHSGLTSADLMRLDRTLAKLARYFDPGKECQHKVEQCREVVQGLSDLWTRNAAAVRSGKWKSR